MAIMYTIRVHAIPLSDSDGDRNTTVTAKGFSKAVDAVNDIFEPANIRFAFDQNKDWHPRKDTALNSLHNGGSKWWVRANKVAAKNRGQFTVFLRWGKTIDKPAGNWFAYPPDTGQRQPNLAKLPHKNIDFIAITNQKSKFGNNASKILAHEIGHFLGLFHTHPTWGKPDPKTVIELVKESGAAGLNGDLLSDTRPDPGTGYYKEKVDSDLCGGPSSFKINGIKFSPDRSNVMSYFRCNTPATFSKQQIKVIRKTILHNTRRHLVDDSAGIRYAGVFRSGGDKHALWVGDDWMGFETKWKQLTGKGLRLVDLETYQIGNKRRYSGVFRAGTDAHALWVGKDWEGFSKKWKELSKKGLRLIDLETWKTGSVRRYAGVFRAGNDAHALWVGDDWAGFDKKWKELSKKGLRLIDMETWKIGSSRRYAGVFREGNDAHALWVNDDWFGFSKKWKELSNKGLRLEDLEVFGKKVS